VEIEDAGLDGPHIHAEGALHTVIISEAVAGFVTMWGRRYANFDDDVNRAQAALVTALGGTVPGTGARSDARGPRW
jgi:hypothetical protein